jgi:hypothetical protein
MSHPLHAAPRDNDTTGCLQLMLATVITPSNAAIFPEYIIPTIKDLVQDSEVSVRCMYAQCIVPLADTAVRYLEMGQALKAHGTYKLGADQQEYDEAQFEVIPNFYFPKERADANGKFRSPTTHPSKTFKTASNSSYLLS